ncbi:MAG: glycosyltransferase family 39 protein [Myxococcota bacterium]|jgi:4-amino-4-deoxy-L-arabinose transferase-like glycosyltransferase|nr:glycosyltransferase family 39 protein [Myxococcota bacterium]
MAPVDTACYGVTTMVDKSKKRRHPVHVDKPLPRTSRWSSFPALLEQRFGTALFVLALLSVSVRVAVMFGVWALPQSYLVAADLAHYRRDGLALAGLSEGSLAPVFGLSPLATFWQALWYWLLGPSVFSVVIPQIGVGTGSVLLTALVGRRVSGSGVGLFAGMMVALSRPLVGFDIALLDTSLSVMLALAAVWMCLWSAQRPSLGTSALLGLTLGIGAVCRPNSLLLAPMAFFILWSAGQSLPLARRCAMAALLVIATLLPIAPVTVSNYVRGNAFVPVTHSAGMNLFFGNYRRSTGRLEPGLGCATAAEAFEFFHEKAEEALVRPLNDAEVSSYWSGQALHEIAQDPRRWLGLLGRKALFGLNSVENPDSWSLPFLELAAPLLRLPFVTFGWLLPLGLLGLALLWRGGPPGTRAIHGVCAYSLLIMVVFFVSSRFRAPAQPLLAIGTAVALAWLLDTAQHTPRPLRKLAPAALLIALGAGVTFLPILEPVMEPEVEALSQAYTNERADQKAIATFERIRAAAKERALEGVELWAARAIAIHQEALRQRQ